MAISRPYYPRQRLFLGILLVSSGLLCLHGLSAASEASSPTVFTGAGPSFALRLQCQPQICLCVISVPVQGTSMAEEEKLAASPEAAAALLSQAGGTTANVRFEAPGGVWDVDALDKLLLFVAANTRWIVTAQTSELAGEGGSLPPSRLSMRHNFSGGRYINLGSPVQVASGGPQRMRLANTMYFRVHIEPVDRAGTYRGQIRFIGLVAP